MDYNTPNNQSSKNRQLEKYFKDAKNKKFKVALSNPCFEFWFLLH